MTLYLILAILWNSVFLLASVSTKHYGWTALYVVWLATSIHLLLGLS